MSHNEDDSAPMDEDCAVKVASEPPFHLRDLYDAVKLGDVHALHCALDWLYDDSINVSVKDGDTALHLACFFGHFPCVELLLDKGADLMAMDDDWAIPLHEACTHGSIKIVQLLFDTALAKSTECFMKMMESVDAKGDTPLHHAARCKHVDIVRLLLSLGASPEKANSSGKVPSELAADNTETKRILEDASQAFHLSSVKPLAAEDPIQLSTNMSSSGSKNKRRCAFSNQTPGSSETPPMMNISSSDDAEDSKSMCKESLPSFDTRDDPREQRVYIEGKKRAKYWVCFKEYVTPTGQRRAECKFCGKTYASDYVINGTKNLKNHALRCPKNLDKEDKGKQSNIVLETPEEKQLNAKLRKVRDSLILMIIVDGLPYTFVDNPGFREYVSFLLPQFHMPSCMSVARDCYKLYLKKRTELKELLGSSCQRVSLTTEMWTSPQELNYLCVTAHFIDKNWKLHKMILNFGLISSHKDESIGKAIKECLFAWGLIDKLFTVTIVDSSSNDVTCDHLRKVIQSKGCISDGNYLHVRCIAQIINRVMWDLVNEYAQSVERVRSAVRFVKLSPDKLHEFEVLVEMLKIEKTTLYLDVPTRWNSTYIMLNRALKFQRVFERLELHKESDLLEPDNVGLELHKESDLLEPDNVGAPLEDDWKKVSKLVVFMEKFQELITRVSGPLGVTSNSSCFYIFEALDFMNQWIKNEDVEFKLMACKVKEKYDEYWGNAESMNMLIYIAGILDPTMKMGCVSVALHCLYGEVKGEMILDKVKQLLNELFKEYKSIYVPLASQSEHEDSTPSNTPDHGDGVKVRIMATLWEKLKAKKRKAYDELVDTELDRYLNEPTEDDCDVLRWWQLNGYRFRVLSHLARDVLAIPVSTVDLESAFSNEGRCLDLFKSYLTPKMLRAMICGQDWFRKSPRQFSIEEELEDLEDLEELEKSLQKIEVDDHTI